MIVFCWRTVICQRILLTEMDLPTCKICNQTIVEKKHKLTCSNCQLVFHRTSLPVMSPSAYKDAKINWNCSSCQQNTNLGEKEDNDERSSMLLPNQPENSFFNKSNNVVVENEEPQYSPVLPKGLKFAHLNINGIKSKFYELQRFLYNEKNIMVLGITKSKLDQHRDFTKEFEYQIIICYDLTG